MKRFVRVGWAASVLAMVVGATACATLPEVQQGICGNGVVEPESGEDCDQEEAAASGDACGAPGSASACRYVCDREKGIACPDNDDWRCGLDKICRRPSPLSWSTALDVPGTGATELIATDLDGDGITDTVSVMPPIVDVTYFEGARTATPGDRILAQSPHPVAGVLADGELPSVALTVSRGLGVFSGTSDRLLLPATNASISSTIVGVRLQPFRDYDPIIPELSADSTGFFGYNDSGILAFRSTPNLAELVQLGGTRSGDGVVARFDAARACQQIAMGVNEKATNRGHAHLFAACDENGPVKLAEISDVALPPAVSLCTDCQPVHALDVDGDARLDLVLIGANGKAYVAYSTGDGHFKSSPDALGTLDAASVPLDMPSSLLPLAVADLNGDCALDFAMPDGIHMSGGLTPGSCAAGAKTPKAYVALPGNLDPHTWSIARLGDVNRDGLLDVVMASAKKPGITAFLGTGGLLLNPVEIVTDAPTKALAVADLDGDLVDDIAFAASGQAEPGTTPYDTLYVSFGSPGGTPTFAESIGVVDNALQILPALEPAIYPDQITDLYVLSQNAPDTSPGVTMYLFPGNSNRQINAPYFFLNTAEQVFDVPRRVAIGTFSNNPGYGDIAVLGRSNTKKTRLWLAQTGADAYIVPSGTTSGAAPRSTNLPGTWSDLEDALMANLGPRDGSSVDELAIAAPPVASATSGTFTSLTTTRASDGAAFDTPALPVDLPDFDITDGNVLAGQMIAARVLDKARVDLVLVSPRSGLAIVPWNAATGALDAGAVQRVAWTDLAGLSCADDVGAKPRLAAGVAALAPDATGRQTLVLVRPGASYLISFDGAAIVAECALIDGGDAVASGDFDGDGIEDIVVSQRTGLTVFYGDARPPGWVAPEERQ